MKEGRRLLRLSLAFNVVLIGVAYFCFWSITSGGQSQLSQWAGHQDSTDFDSLLGNADAGAGAHVDASTKPTTRSCNVCDAGDTGKALCDKWGSDVVARTMAFTDGNARLKRVLAKWRSGQPVRLAAIGGSNSAGQGVWDDNAMTYSKLNMHVILFNHLNQLFPQPDGSVMEDSPSATQNHFFNGAQFGKSSEYFVMCSQIHLPEDVDLIVVELSVNDQYTLDATESYEYLIRTLLERPGEPAVIELQTFSYELPLLLAGGASHLASNLYYNIPTVAPRTLFYESAQNDVNKFWDWFYWYNPHERPKDLAGVDLRHFGPGGHKASGDLLSAYIDQQLCEMDAMEAKAGHTDIEKLYPAQQIPKLSLLSTFSRDHPNAATPKVQPTCQVIDSKEHPLDIKSSHGWEKWTWRNEETGKEKHYLRATTPGSKVTFNLPPVTGRIEMYFLRSKSFGLGNAKCWLDEGNDEQTVEGYWENNENVGQILRWTDVKQGDHSLTCELLDETADPKGGKEFRIISVMSF